MTLQQLICPKCGKPAYRKSVCGRVTIYMHHTWHGNTECWQAFTGNCAPRIEPKKMKEEQP